MSFAATLVRCSKAPSSQRWLARHFRDPLVKQRLASPEQFRARSAFKLLELENLYHFLQHKDVRSVVDLGAAPGGWSQVLSGKLGWAIEDALGTRGMKSAQFDARAEEVLEDNFGLAEDVATESYGSWSVPERANGAPQRTVAAKPGEGRATIVAVDLLPMYPIPGVKTLQMDFLSPEADQCINAFLTEGPDDGVRKADVILSDMAANFSGNRIADSENSVRIAEAVFEFTKRHLRTAKDIGRARGGVLVYVVVLLRLILIPISRFFAD